MKLLFLRSFSNSDTNYLIDNLKEVYNIIIPESFDDTNLLELIKDVDVCIGLKISKELIENAKNLKIIQVPGAGVNMLNMSLLNGTNIKVCNSHSNARFVAEYGVSMLFSLIKKIHIHDRYLREGIWFKPKNDETDYLFQNDTILNKKIGIIGFGKIGQHIAKYLSSFDTEILCVDKSPKNEIYKGTFKNVELNDLLKESDIVFITVPLTIETNNMLNDSTLKSMKPDSYLINISRSEVLNQSALFNLMQNRKIRGAAIDVWYNDSIENDGRKYPSDKYPFHKLDNILLSPYRAGYLMNYSPHLYDVVKNLKLFALTNTVINEVDINLGY